MRVIREMDLADARITGLALLGLSVAVVSLRWRGFRSATSSTGWVVRPRAGSVDPEAARASIDRVVASVGVAAQLLPLAMVSCLPRAIVMQALLRHEGTEAALRIGVCADVDGLQAHAWVEVAGCVVSESPGDVERFHAFDEPITSAVVAAMR